MTRFTHIKTHWSPEDAHSILSLLDELRDVLWQSYGNDIIEYNQQQHTNETADNSNDQIDLLDEEMDDLIPF